MYKILVYVAFGFLTLSGTLHFAIDVVSQYIRGKRPPGDASTLYYGLNSAYALGQIAFGVLGLLAAREAIDLFRRGPVIALCLLVAAAWLAIALRVSRVSRASRHRLPLRCALRRRRPGRFALVATEGIVRSSP